MQCLFFYRVYGSYGDYPAPCVDDCSNATPDLPGVTLAVDVDVVRCESQAWKTLVVDLKTLDNMGHPSPIPGARIYPRG